MRTQITLLLIPAAISLGVCPQQNLAFQKTRIGHLTYEAASVFDVDKDSRLDIVTGGWWGQTLRWRQNPKGKITEWTVHDIDKCGSIETIRCWDIDRDGIVEVVPNLVYDVNRDFSPRPHPQQRPRLRPLLARTENQRWQEDLPQIINSK